MKLSLSQNIAKLRKAHGITQEQVAEALGVSCAAVSKWERGVATPELSLIAEMANLFDVSVDVLIGYEFHGNGRNAAIQQLKNFLHDRSFQNTLPEIEKVLRRYPNCFEIVYYGAENYRVQGLVRKDTSCLKRALALFRHACQLIDQNTDPNISETDLWKAMANIHIALEETDKAVELLKAHNPCRLNHPLIGQTLASLGNDPQNALPFLSAGLLDLTVTHMQVTIGYINVYCKTEDWQNALSLLEWALAFYPGLAKPGQANCLDKGLAVLWAIRAYVHLERNEKEQAADCLLRAKAIARRFDAAPNYNVSSLRFIAADTAFCTVDDLGSTAAEGIENIVSDFANDEFSRLWRETKNE